MKLFRLSTLSLVAFLLALNAMTILVSDDSFQAYGQEQEFRQREFTDEPGHPDIYDPNLHAEVVVEGLELPTTMAFLGPNDMLVLEKEERDSSEDHRWKDSSTTITRRQGCWFY